MLVWILSWMFPSIPRTAFTAGLARIRHDTFSLNLPQCVVAPTLSSHVTALRTRKYYMNSFPGLPLSHIHLCLEPPPSPTNPIYPYYYIFIMLDFAQHKPDIQYCESAKFHSSFVRAPAERAIRGIPDQLCTSEDPASNPIEQRKSFPDADIAIFKMPPAPRYKWHPQHVVQAFKSLDAVLQDPYEMPYEEFGLDDNLKWQYVRSMHDPESTPAIVNKDALAPVIVGGMTYDVPIVVRDCIESLIQTGSRQGLVIDTYSEQRCKQLTDIYARGPYYGRGFTLRDETTADVFELLSHHIKTLPIAPIHPAFFRLFYRWCCIPTHIRNQECQSIKDQYESIYQAKVLDATLHGWSMPKRPVRDIKVENVEKQEAKQVVIAVLLLRMLPLSHQALIIYLMDFLLDLCTYSRYGMTPVEVTKKFADKVVRGLNIKQSEAIMVWLLTRWPEISEAMFRKSRPMYEEVVRKSVDEFIAANLDSPHPSCSMSQCRPSQPQSTASKATPQQSEPAPQPSDSTHPKGSSHTGHIHFGRNLHSSKPLTPREIAAHKESEAVLSHLRSQAADIESRYADLDKEIQSIHTMSLAGEHAPNWELAWLKGEMRRLDKEKRKVCHEMKHIHRKISAAEDRLARSRV